MFYNDVSAFCVTAVSAIGLALVDRFVLARGRVQILETAMHKATDSHLRFGFRYNVKGQPAWSKVEYSLHDENDPTTVIVGKERSLSFSKPGENHEYLLIRKDLVSSGNWMLKIRVHTTAGRSNPFYTIYPFSVTHSHTVEINGDE